MSGGFYRFSVCVCTRNRPDELRAALASVLASAHPAHDIVVSDDSTDTSTRAMLAAEFPSVLRAEGPRRGLGGNRNNAIAQARGTHVLFLDDDAVLAPDFLGRVAACLDALGERAARTIVSGGELNAGRRVVPHKVSFLGYQSRRYRDGDRHETIVINATVFPRALFEHLRFDPNLVYGCDEIDLAVRAVHRYGFQVHFLPDAANFHFPSRINREFYAPFAEASRIYVQFKRYYWLERRRAKAACFLALAHAHILLHFLRRDRLAGFAAFRATAATSLGYIRACARDPDRFL
jgi:glycosyltransferase involved in cell wall biosynthesis